MTHNPAESAVEPSTGGGSTAGVIAHEPTTELGPIKRAVFRRIPMRTTRAVLLLGLVVALAWRLLQPLVHGHTVPQERDVSVDGLFAALGLLAGLMSIAAGAMLDRGATISPSARLIWLVVLSGFTSASAAWLGGIGGGPHIRALGVMLVWPATVSFGVFCYSIIKMTLKQEDATL